MRNRIATFMLSLSKRHSRRNLYPLIQAELDQVGTLGSILSVGSGGDIEEFIRTVTRHNDCRFVTLDISSDRDPDIVGDICEATFRNEFDVIVMAEVLEHVLHPQIACYKLYDALRPGGKLILSTPFIFPLHDRPHDYWRFTRYGLSHLLAEAGFSDVSVNERNGWGEAIAVLFWRVVNTPGYPRSAKIIGTVLAALFSPIGSVISKIWPHDCLTTGYVTTAVKARH